MGFFSDLLPELDEAIKSNNVNLSVDYEQLHKKNKIKIPVNVVGLQNQLNMASEYIESRRRNHQPALIYIYGCRGSGKSSLAKAILKKEKLGSRRIVISTVENADNPLAIMENLLPIEGGLILEGAEEARNPSIQRVLSRIFTQRELQFQSGKKIHLSKMVIVVTASDNKTDVEWFDNACCLEISYSANDIAIMYLQFLNDYTKDNKEKNIAIDRDTLSYVFYRFGGNVSFFKRWLKDLLELVKGEVKFVVDMTNIEDILNDMRVFEYEYKADEELASESSDEENE